jgi:adenosylhomocysteinase
MKKDRESEKLPELLELFPLMDRLAEYLQNSGSLNGVKIGWHCHLTQLTLLTAEALVAGGAKLFLSECNPATSDSDAIESIRKLGASVFTGDDSPDKVLDFSPQLLTDTGFVLTERFLARPEAKQPKSVIAGSEITTSGIEKIRKLAAQGKQLPLPVVNINGGMLKARIENFHGVGDGVVDLLRKITGRSLSGLNAVVLGYGPVGAGVAFHLRKEGAIVNVVDTDPVRRLIAHFDGFSVNDCLQSLQSANIVVTATGKRKVISKEHWQAARDGAIFMNVGHWPDELDLKSLNSLASETLDFDFKTRRYNLIDDVKSEKKVYVIAEGNPANIVLLTGSIEPTLIHLTTESLCLSYLATNASSLANGEHLVPYEVEQLSSQLSLEALGA